jgi:hypothetical protein
MEQTKFTTEELQKIKELQDKYQVLGIQSIQLKLAKKSTEEYLTTLNDQESQLNEQIYNVNQEEKDFAKTLSDKYGVGSLDLESGLFTPNQAKN